ncbi:MFS transporter, partial [Lactobacillus amylovorus]|nr:MFS transporter [Lactobacillus amylovorus]
NIRQQKNSSSNTFLHSLTVALNLTIQDFLHLALLI